MERYLKESDKCNNSKKINKNKRKNVFFKGLWTLLIHENYTNNFFILYDFVNT
jgi:hypothetical protein